ncbi:hypothetical protein AcW1_010137 [Taiwanofungus camphoratus]|nr:hypothetical protein AcV5_003032 [Antrodia cinnamomea]KAI0946768.1 hypothetical protein AcW1_010137 [Antrodia cinnamomea]
MEDEHPYLFILIFRDHSSLETWRAHVQSLVTVYQQQRCERALEEFGGECESCVYPPGFCASQKAMRMLGRSTVASATVSTTDSLLLIGSSRYSLVTYLVWFGLHGPCSRIIAQAGHAGGQRCTEQI